MEENKKGQNTLYAVIGIATLVVAIIGATFAYFSAQATAGGDAIEGGTNDIANSLTLNVERELFGGTAETAPETEEEHTVLYQNLVPANIQVTQAGIKGAVTSHCIDEENGFTGCHLYKITASSEQPIDASVVLYNLNTTATDKGNWKFVIYSNDTGNYEDVTTLVTESAETFTTSTARLTTPETGFDMHNGAELNGTKYYYLLIYLANVEGSQNNVENGEDPVTDETGTYSGTVVLNAASGNISATFNAYVEPIEP